MLAVHFIIYTRESRHVEQIASYVLTINCDISLRNLEFSGYQYESICFSLISSCVQNIFRRKKNSSCECLIIVKYQFHIISKFFFF